MNEWCVCRITLILFQYNLNYQHQLLFKYVTVHFLQQHKEKQMLISVMLHLQ